MIMILHGYLLEGSGSNLWTRAVIRALCRSGETVHLVCQENHPERYDFIGQAFTYHEDGTVETMLSREVPFAGRCIMHKPKLCDPLPVYVSDKYEEFSEAIPMVDLPDTVIHDYLARNIRVVQSIVSQNEITAMHANHAVLMSVVAHKVGEATNVPFAIMPHGSAIEYAVKKDKRFWNYANAAFNAAENLLVIGPEIKTRLNNVFPEISGLNEKMTELNLGVDTSLFGLIEPADRSARVQEMCDRLATMPRGKTPDQTLDLLEGLNEVKTVEEFQTLTSVTSKYDGKCPDADVEAKLGAIDWENDSLILFVGRLIASKGFQAIAAALPEILSAKPNARLVAVGHGPNREVMESFVAALSQGDETTLNNIVQWGSVGETHPKPFAEVRHYFDKLKADGLWEDYLEKAKQFVSMDRVVFTGYLTHNELCSLFPCVDVAVFPSIVAEAGPLVFLEALACGCFPLGTYFAGMAASIDAVSQVIGEDANAMKLRPDPEWITTDIAAKVPEAFALTQKNRQALRDLSVQKYDWVSVAEKLKTTLSGEMV